MAFAMSNTRICPRASLGRCRISPSLGSVVPLYTSRRQLAHANPIPILSTPSGSCETISPYPFKPYSLSSLDTNSSSSHHFTSLSFSLPPNHIPHALNRLEGAILRLIDHYPFLTGNVTQSSHGASTLNQSGDAFEIQPVTASLMQHIPMLQTQHHPATSALAPSNHLPDTFLPFPSFSDSTKPSPTLRCKANVQGTRLVLVFGWDTRVIDAGGVFAVVRTLAEFCRDPGAAKKEMPVPGPWAQAGKESQAAFHNLGLSSLCSHRHGNASTHNAKDLMPSMAEETSLRSETGTARLNEDKIAMLTDACNLLVGRVANDAYPRRLNQEDVVSAVVGVCGSRARNQTSGSNTHSAGTVSVSTDLRRLFPLSTPPTYMGNATVSIPVPVQQSSLPALQDSQMRSLLPDISPRDFHLVCKIAVSLRGRMSAMDKGSEETNMTWETEDWDDTPKHGMQIHTLRPMNFFSDFGPLGRVREVNVPGTRENGTCWVLPERERCGWDVMATVEPEAMQQLRGDKLMRWMIDGVGF